ncbi:hypothetical protein ABE61_19635 [Lysinibacillus sphaericus]|uniref:hypothetical protein n=1 Tax=Lysinibacillus sphaericus TaxID=1421 RepID=UPI0018CE36A2|nr:hypothetical protein [Lysinibacillus sphaericus]MBG9456191.1 hypothetical protein [Lysinibacillus sphaericus]MBG9479187.1 hypothetical protein [Lysinibacillus sphaericus]MBG9591515.1 hypothetical protein [Lysinibacillus sphaericus]
MKKSIIILVLIAAIGVYRFCPKAHVEEPIVMSVQLDGVSKTLAVSYIVEQNNDTYLMEIAHNTKGFYPSRNSGNWDGKTNFTKVLAVQNGYELREDVVELTNEQLSNFLSFEGRTLPVELSFANYSPIETTLALLMAGETVDVIKIDDMLRYKYTSSKDETIDSIGHYNSVATISFDQNNEEVVFPLTLTKGSSVDILIHEPYKLSSKDKLLLEITMIDGQSVTKNILMTKSIPKGYLKQIVKEANANNN